VKLRVDQGRSGGLAQGLKARIVLRSQPQISLSATVARVELLGDSVTEERIAQLAFDKAPLGMSVGEMAEATIQLPSLSQSLIIPAASIQRQGGATGVWRMESGKLVFVTIKPGATSLEGQTQILDGLKAGDEVVVYSQKPLSAGVRLQVVDAIVAPAGGAGAAQ
jgi:HlyD family secretion protein